MRKCNIFTSLRRKLADEQRGAMLAELLITPPYTDAMYLASLYTLYTTVTSPVKVYYENKRKIQKYFFKFSFTILNYYSYVPDSSTRYLITSSRWKSLKSIFTPLFIKTIKPVCVFVFHNTAVIMPSSPPV